MCRVCGKNFSQKFYLMVHVRTHTEEKPHQFSDCRKAFSRSAKLNPHKRVHNRGEDIAMQ